MVTNANGQHHVTQFTKTIVLGTQFLIQSFDFNGKG